MSTINKYRVWCDTDSKWEYMWAETTPTKCPTNTAHSIDSAKITIVDKVTEDLMTIREEDVVTGGHYQACFHKIIIPSGSSEVIHDVTFPHPISLLAAEWTNSADIAGDEIEFVVAPNTIVGALASGVASGITVLPVQQSVIDNIKLGYHCDLYSASGVQDIGRVVDINDNYNTVTVDLSTTQSYSAAWPTYFRMHIDMVVKSPLAGFGRIQLGEAKIGGSYIPANDIFLQSTSLSCLSLKSPSP